MASQQRDLKRLKKKKKKQMVKVKVRFTLEEATKAQRGSRGISLLFP
jgi:hypothetical protein